MTGTAYSVRSSARAQREATKRKNEEQLARAKEQVLEDFGEAIASPEGLAAAQEQLAEVAENVMNGMIDSDDVTSLDIREMRLLSAQLSIGSMMAKEEQYAIPCRPRAVLSAFR